MHHCTLVVTLLHITFTMRLRSKCVMSSGKVAELFAVSSCEISRIEVLHISVYIVIPVTKSSECFGYRASCQDCNDLDWYYCFVRI